MVSLGPDTLRDLFRYLYLPQIATVNIMAICYPRGEGWSRVLKFQGPRTKSEIQGLTHPKIVPTDKNPPYQSEPKLYFDYHRHKSKHNRSPREPLEGWAGPSVGPIGARPQPLPLLGNLVTTDRVTMTTRQLRINLLMENLLKGRGLPKYTFIFQEKG